MKRIEEKVGDLLRRWRATVSVAESCTGGLIAHRITNIPGSSDYFESGIVSYSNQAKGELLGVPPSLIDDYGPVSEPVARKMAEGIRDRRKTTIGLATTGVAGPLGGTSQTPVGTVFIGLASPNETVVRKFHFAGERTKVKDLAAETALHILFEYSIQHEKER
jgi:nicotinamide-nucleotide amidase